ncbi:ppGpp synthetase/RelA/SpoT-type nucleotidyltransferase [Alkalibacillus flavidus]|uniref:PpGpp synthetase/RelA/SpoT-type nucleotidyltransferase n=1 Tax=Alkalibacillus flavidus TaxID=546021 RepID=A0ABV2KVN5_9BACI
MNYNVPIVGRVKNKPSIIHKLLRKRNEDQGNYPINKYLNDLLGFRVIDQNYHENLSDAIKYIEHLKSNGVRIINKERHTSDYKAYHIYFMGESNHCFPIELQIWDSKHEQSNIKSHEMYKKVYTNWLSKYQRNERRY